jgi:hypothetical protein
MSVPEDLSRYEDCIIIYRITNYILLGDLYRLALLYNNFYY